MARLLAHVEGETEETFVNEVLWPHLQHYGYTVVSARLLGNTRQRDRRGGIRGWNSARDDILDHLKEDTGCLVTTMVDYYALPQSGPRVARARGSGRTAFCREGCNCAECAARRYLRRDGRPLQPCSLRALRRDA